MPERCRAIRAGAALPERCRAKVARRNANELLVARNAIAVVILVAPSLA